MRWSLPIGIALVAVLSFPASPAAADPVTTINGTVPPGTVAPMEDVTVMLDTIQTDGHEPMMYPAGTCYYMPPDTPMTAANLGIDDVRLIDTFVFPPGEHPMTTLEPGD